MIGGFLEIDVSNPSAPFREEFFQTAGWCRGLSYTNDYLYVSTDCSFQVLNKELVGGIDDNLNSTCNVMECELSNFPNPFNHTTTISFSLPENTKNAEIIIYNFKGQQIKRYSIFNPSKASQSNQYSIQWDGKNESGETVNSEIYFYQLNINNKSISTKKMILNSF